MNALPIIFNFQIPQSALWDRKNIPGCTFAVLPQPHREQFILNCCKASPEQKILLRQNFLARKFQRNKKIEYRLQNIS